MFTKFCLQKLSFFEQDYDEEIERLRREIQRYRMELSNRETNFNRMFAEKSPLHTDGGRSNRSNKQAMMQQAFENGVIMRIARERTGQSMAGFDMQRERTLPVSNTSNHSRIISDEADNKSDPYDYQVK